MPERAVLLVNLGSPDSPSVADVRRYLDQFLMDPRVIDVPWILRRLIVSTLILPRRPKATSEAYNSIWMDTGSPLKVYTKELAEKLETRLGEPVRWAMRYGSPGIEEELLALASAGVRHVRFLPLYPHYAMSTTETSLVEAQRVITEHKLDLTLEPLPNFHDHPAYIAELAALTREHLACDDHLLFSYHGLPEYHLRKTDPTRSHCLSRPDCCQVASPAHAFCYKHQVLVTAELVAESLGLPPERFEVSFQSRLGRAKWIEPYTDQVLEALPARGVKKLAVICPAFVADNLETLEEIGMQGRETFLAAGGESFKLIPCLNARPGWIDALADILREGAVFPEVVNAS